LLLVGVLLSDVLIVMFTSGTFKKRGLVGCGDHVITYDFVVRERFLMFEQKDVFWGAFVYGGPFVWCVRW
jgi:hypothetical protein